MNYKLWFLVKSERSFDQMVSFCARIELCSKKWRRIALKETEIYLSMQCDSVVSIWYNWLKNNVELLSFNTIKIEKSSVYAYPTASNTIQRFCMVSYVFLSICCSNLNDNNKLQRSISRGVRSAKYHFTNSLRISFFQSAWKKLCTISKITSRFCFYFPYCSDDCHCFWEHPAMNEFAWLTCL